MSFDNLRANGFTEIKVHPHPDPLPSGEGEGIKDKARLPRFIWNLAMTKCIWEWNKEREPSGLPLVSVLVFSNSY